MHYLLYYSSSHANISKSSLPFSIQMNVLINWMFTQTNLCPYWPPTIIGSISNANKLNCNWRNQVMEPWKSKRQNSVQCSFKEAHTLEYSKTNTMRSLVQEYVMDTIVRGKQGGEQIFWRQWYGMLWSITLHPLKHGTLACTLKTNQRYNLRGGKCLHSLGHKK